jgi:hypothetical protein
MASLGTLAAELKLEGAAAMMAGLRGAGAAVSGLGGKVAGAQGPLARFGQALQGLRLPAARRREFSQAGPVLPPVGRPSRLPGVGPARVPAAGRPSRLPGVGHARVPAVARPSRLPGVGPARELRFASAHGRLRAIAQRLATGTAALQPETRAIRGRSAGAPREGGGDRLARVGGFIGGGGGPALDYHRRTAAATERTAAALQSLAQRWTGADKGPMTAVWA